MLPVCQVVDTPDVFNMETSYARTVAEDALRQTKEFDVITAVIYVIRLDVRLTPLDQQLFNKYIDILPASCHDNVILAFTRLEGLKPVMQEVRLSSMYDLLKSAGNRHLDICLHSSTHELRSTLLSYLPEMKNGPKSGVEKFARQIAIVIPDSPQAQRLMLFVLVLFFVFMYYLLHDIIGYYGQQQNQQSRENQSFSNSNQLKL
jgi:hypothetical protein